MRLLWRWTIAMLAAELVGFGLAGLAAWALVSTLGEGLATNLLIAGAGAVEGAILGAAQAWVLADVFPRVSVRRWVVLTALVAGALWLVGMSMGSVFGAVGPVLPMLAAGLVLAMGALLGFAQWLELRRHTARAWRWIPANAFAWGLALLWTYGATALVDESTPIAWGATLVVASGLLMGATAGALTGWALERVAWGEERSRKRTRTSLRV